MLFIFTRIDFKLGSEILKTLLHLHQKKSLNLNSFYLNNYNKNDINLKFQSFGSHLFSIPSFVWFPFRQPWPPVLQRVLFGILESTAVAKSTLRLHSRNHVHCLKIHLQPFADALFHWWFGAPTSPSTFHF